MFKSDKINILNEMPKSLLNLKNPPKKLYFLGNKNLLTKFKIAIVGTRHPNQYTKTFTQYLVTKISKYATIVSGGAIGVDTIAHTNSFPNTIMIAPSSLEINYPKANSKLIEKIAKEALILSEYEKDYMPHKYSFLQRNRIVVALSDIIIFPQGDLKSGTSSSVKIALTLKKKIFTIPHRIGESELTNLLLAQNNAEAIYNIDNFIEKYIDTNAKISNTENKQNDEIIELCKSGISYEEAFKKYGNKILEYEFLGLLVRQNNIIKTK